VIFLSSKIKINSRNKGECPAGIQGAAEKGRFYNAFGIKFFYQFLKNRILKGRFYNVFLN
jgi:hypothetical protein